jgi:uncharacterized cupredoxin-like copper-binding protein
MGRQFALLAVCALVPFALAACGGDEDDGGGGGATISVEADPGGELAYVQKSLSGSAGENTFEFDNPSSTGHDFCIDDDGGAGASREAIFVYHTGASAAIGCTDVITAETTTLTENLDAGDYIFYCSVSGHREAGMEGTLTVN